MERDCVDDAGRHEGLAESLQRPAAERFRTLSELVGWSVERGLWFLRRRIVWPLEDGAAALGTRGCIGVGGGAAFLLATVGSAVVLLAGAGSEPVTAPASPVAAIAIEQPRLIFIGAGAQRPEVPRETLHGAVPVFAPPAAKRAPARPATPASPVAATISSNPKKAGAKASTSTAAGAAAVAVQAHATAARATAAQARPALTSGPPAGPAALKVAREFAQGFVAYETGGEASEFEGAFGATATPELTKALLQRPPKQPAGVKVPRAKVLNVVAAPSEGRVYPVSVSLLRVGVTSELRLQMEKAEKGGRAEWRVTDVLG